MGKMVSKKSSREDREKEILLGLVDLYVKQGRPIGSNTLKESGYDHLSSATIRNYFAKLEEEGYLKQHHASGGRLPTDKAFRLYASEEMNQLFVSKDDDLFLAKTLLQETKEVSSYLQKAIQVLSEMTNCTVFLASPRFDQDFVTQIQLMKIDDERILCAILTDFGLVHTHILYYPEHLTFDAIKRLEEYFHYRLTGIDRPTLSEEEESFAKQSYNEIVLRHFISYTHMESEEIYKAGFSKLLSHPEFHDPAILSNTLSLFENTPTISHILNHCFKEHKIHYWIGDDLKTLIKSPHHFAIVAVPYFIHQKSVGAIAILGPERMAYGRIMSLISRFSEYLSENLTKTLYKFKLTYRQPISHQALEQKRESPQAMKLTHKTREK